MKKIGEPRRVTAANALGHEVTTINTAYEIEAIDIGLSKPHYLGFNHGSYTIKPSDLGRQIVIQESPIGSWCCWYFPAHN